MKNIYIVLFCFFASFFRIWADIEVKKDNGNPFIGTYPSRASWEESVLLTPEGPCNINEIHIYFAGTTPSPDTVFIVGDPSEGSIPPTFWVLSYNMIYQPIVIDYNGTPGWYKFKTPGLRSEGYDRIVIQHKLKAAGPWFGIDNDGLSSPASSFLMNPNQNNSLGGPGVYYLSNADFMVRLLVDYDFKDGDKSQKPPAPSFSDVTKLAGITYTNGNYISASDVSIVDWNNDGWDDIAIGSNFFINNKNGTFSNISTTVNVSAGATSWADFNNDGNIDIYALNNGSYNENLKMVFSRDKLYLNKGNNTFQPLNNKDIFNLPYPSPAKAFNLSQPDNQDSIFNPYNCITPLWFDANNDGRPDLFLANNRVGVTIQGQYSERYFPDEIWIQDNNGKFVNARESSKIGDAEPFNPSGNWFGYYDEYGAGACDYNMDNKTDIFVATYRLVRDLLYKNNGDGTFSNVGATTGVQGVPTADPAAFGHGMGLEWADFNNDGYPDLFVGNLGHPDWRGMYSNPSLIFENQGPPNYNFREVRKRMGLKFFEMNAGVVWADFNLDGYKDLWHGQISYYPEGQDGEPKRTGRFYFNQGPPDYKLKDMNWFLGENTRLHNSWNAARIDFDNDGDLDLLIASGGEGVRLLRNDLKHEGSWIAFRLEGKPAEAVSMDAFGTKIMVFAGGKKFFRELNGAPAGSKCTQNSNELHFGLGKVNSIDSVVVTYSNNKSMVYNNFKINCRYKIPYLTTEKLNIVSTPALTYPQNYSINLPNNIGFTWENISGAVKYQIQIASDIQFNSIITTNDKLSNNSFNFNHNTDGMYYWRVRAFSDKDSSSWSSIWMYNVGVQIPSKPELISPANDSLVATLLPLFKWTESKYAIPYGNKTTYNLYILKEPNSDTVVSVKDLTTNSFQLLEPLSPDTKYYWGVSVANQGKILVHSNIWSFNTLALPSKVILNEPTDKSKDIPIKPEFKWDAVKLADGYKLQISESQNFDTLFFESSQIFKNSYKILKSLSKGHTYYWRVLAYNSAGEGDWSEVFQFTVEGTIDVIEPISDNLISLEITPNPVLDNTKIIVNLSEPLNCELTVYDIIGNRLIELNNSWLQSGITEFTINKGILSPGFYFAVIKSCNKIQFKVFIILN